MLQDTSLMAYMFIKPELNRRENQVYEALRCIQPATNLDLSKETNLPINSITPRVNALAKKGLIQRLDTTIQITGRRAIRWMINE